MEGYTCRPMVWQLAGMVTMVGVSSKCYPLLCSVPKTKFKGFLGGLNKGELLLTLPSGKGGFEIIIGPLHQQPKPSAAVL